MDSGIAGGGLQRDFNSALGGGGTNAAVVALPLAFGAGVIAMVFATFFQGVTLG